MLRSTSMNGLDPELESLAARLEASGEYKVLRRLRRAPRIARSDLPEGAREAVALDLETTGLDATVERPIEVGLVRFAYDASGRILGVTDELGAFEDPGRPLSEDIARLTGLCDADLAGQRFPDDRVHELLDGAVLVIAHNAGFDRPFAERRWPVFEAFPWACSLRDIAWRDAEGFDGASLSALLAAQGVFFEGHRAVEDGYAVIDLLGRPLRSDGELAFNRLRATARAATVRLWAVRSPFETKDLLKARGYRWSAQGKCWWCDVVEASLEAELDWLGTAVYPRGVPALPRLRIDPTVRYSWRVSEAPPA
jgi:DNA polymerase III subunit epsilon